ncbi:MAG: class II glutamine amidotransferase [Betaproteobacteria bacterium]|nr:class II glutamine amidotransferase [Betaproteobacteria bacterium]
MCRALLYLGQPVLLDNLLYQPDSALVKQSYMPKMLHLLNLAGFGLRAWDPHSHAPDAPFTYGSSSLPVFDRNLKNLAEKVRATCVLGHVRGVAYSTVVDISLQNVHPFQFPGVLLAMAHNGDLARMSEMKPLLAKHVNPKYLPHIRGTTDSEWIYALIVSALPDPNRRATRDELLTAIETALKLIRAVRAQLGIAVSSSVNLFMTDGHQLAAVRYCFDFGCYATNDPRACKKPTSISCHSGTRSAATTA